MEYRLVTLDEFIKNHNHIHYCECIIFNDQRITYAVPSHIEALIKLSGVDRNELEDEIPTSADPSSYLCDKLNSISIWYDYCIVPLGVSEDSLNVLYSMYQSGILDKYINIKVTSEINQVKLLEDVDTYSMYKLQELYLASRYLEKDIQNKLISLERSNITDVQV